MALSWSLPFFRAPTSYCELSEDNVRRIAQPQGWWVIKVEGRVLCWKEVGIGMGIVVTSCTWKASQVGTLPMIFECVWIRPG